MGPHHLIASNKEVYVGSTNNHEQPRTIRISLKSSLSSKNNTPLNSAATVLFSTELVIKIKSMEREKEDTEESTPVLMKSEKENTTEIDLPQFLIKEATHYASQPLRAATLIAQSQRYKSTGTYFETGTVARPDYSQTFFCIAAILQAETKATLLSPASTMVLHPEFNVDFLPPHFLLDANITAELDSTTHFDFMVKFIDYVCQLVAYPIECNIIALVYVNRAMANGNISLTSKSWANVWVSAIMIAQKMWDDRSFKTSAFVKILPGVTKHQLRDMEWKLLDILNFDLGVKPSLYASYYFEMRSMYAEFYPGAHAFNLEEMSSFKEKRLQSLSHSLHPVRVVNSEPSVKSTSKSAAVAGAEQSKREVDTRP